MIPEERIITALETFDGAYVDGVNLMSYTLVQKHAV
jgi:hypothetical protein